MYDLLIIHSQDTTAWTDYILGYLNKGSFNKKTLILRDADLVSRLDDAATRSAISTAKAIIIIASPVHLQFLIECPTFSYSGLVPDIRKAQIFLCGSEMVDFDGRDLEGSPIFHRFPDFFNWRKLTHDKHAELLTNAMILMEAEEKPVSPATHKVKSNSSNGGKRRRKREFEITPTKAKCEEATTITLLFAESVADSADQFTMEIVFREKNVVDSVPISIVAKWRNPYTYQFIAPDFSAGVTNFTVALNGTEIGSKKLVYYYGDERLTQIYIHQMARLCRYINDFGLLTNQVDGLLSEIFDERLALPIPVKAFENIFVSNCSRNEDQNQYEFPTLLHLAAKFGFKEFATKLIDLPEARRAYDIRNIDGLLPEVIARNSGHLELARLFQDFHVVNETITSVYEIYLPEQRHSQRLSDASEYSVTPTAVLSSSGSEDIYMEMRGRSPSRTGKKENSESDNEEGGYVDMDEQELAEAIQKQKQKEELRQHMKRENREMDVEQCHEEQQASQTPTQTPAEPTKTDDAIRLESLTLEDVPNIADVPESQKELIGILTMVIQNKISVAEGEYLIKGWNFRHNQGRSRSFKEKQVQLSKMRDQVTKAKDKIKEPSWWNSVVTVLKKRPSNTSPTQPTVASCADSLSASAPKPIRQLSLQENLAIGAKTRKFYKVPMTPDPRTSENVPSLLEPISESPQRNSNASASSRESLLSVTSRTSTSSGVDIDTVDEEHMTELELRIRNPQQGNLDYGVRHTPLCKRKSRNLEMLEEELTCSDAPSPPPLPPRTGPRAEACRGQVGKNSSTSLRSGQPIKHTITSVALPPMPHQTRNRSSSDGCILPMQPTHQLLAKGKPPWKSVDQPPPVSPRLLKRDTFQLTQRRPAPVVPKISSDPAIHAVRAPKIDAELLSPTDNLTIRPYVQCPVPAAGRAHVIRSRSRENKTKTGSISKQVAATDPGIVKLQTAVSSLERNLSESGDKLFPVVGLLKVASEEATLPTYRVLRAHTSPEITPENRDCYKLRSRFQAEPTLNLDALRQLTTAECQNEQLQQDHHHHHHQRQQQQQQQDQSHFHQQQGQQRHQQHQLRYKQQPKAAHSVDVQIPAIEDATIARTGEQKVDEVSTIKYMTIEARSIAIVDTSEEPTTEKYQQPQQQKQHHQHQQESNYADVKNPVMTGEQESEEDVLYETRATVESLSDKLKSDSSSGVDDILLSSNEEDASNIHHRCLRKARRYPTTNRPPPVFHIQEFEHKTGQGGPLVLPGEIDALAAHEVEDLPCIEPGICLPPFQTPEHTENPQDITHIPTDSETPLNNDVTTTRTSVVDDTTCISVIVQSSVLDSCCRSSETEASFGELKNFLSQLENAPRDSLSRSTSVQLQKTGSPAMIEDEIPTKENPFVMLSSNTGTNVHVSDVTPISESELARNKVLQSETLDPSLPASEAIVTPTPADVIEVSSRLSPTLITAEPQKPIQINASNSGTTEMSNSTEAANLDKVLNQDAADSPRSRIGLSYSPPNDSDMSGSVLEGIERPSEQIPADNFQKQTVNISSPDETTSSRPENESEVELRRVSLQIGETATEGQTSERGPVVEKLPAKKQPSKEGTIELSVARPKKCLPAKPPKARQVDRSNSGSGLEEQSQGPRPSSKRMQDDVRPDVTGSSSQLEISTHPIAGREELNTLSSSDHVKLTAPPKVPSKPFKGARK